MARACTAKTRQLGPLMQLSDLELKLELNAVTAADPVEALHLSHELLSAQRYYPRRTGLCRVVGREVKRIGGILENQPEIDQ